MKRSEMVKIMNRELRAQSSGNSDIDACQLLSFMEAAGMLPPLIREVKYTPQYEGDDNTCIGGQDYYTIVSMLQWEDEDEKK